MIRTSVLPALCLSLMSCGTLHESPGNFIAMSEKDFDPSLTEEVVKLSIDFAGGNGFVVTRQAGSTPLYLTLSRKDVTIHVTENQRRPRLHIEASGVPTSQAIKIANKYITSVGEIHP